MNKIVLAMFVTMLIHLAGYAELKLDPQYRKAVERGAATRIDVHVVDDEGSAVQGATVKAVFASQDGERSGSYVSDENGVAIVEGITTGHYVELRLSRDGYYDSKVKYRYLRLAENRAVKDGKWQPWGKDERIVLRKICEQVQPVTHGGPYDIPKTNEWVSFDMQERDWVAPFGKGKEADVEFLFSWYGKDPLNWERQRFGVRFPGNPYNGGYLCGTKKESSFPYAFRAATGNTDFHRELFDDMNCGKHCFGMLDGTSDFVFRIRSVTNSVGRLLSCNYGRFRLLDYGVERTGMGSMMMRYDYNPSSMDTNLEFKK